MMPSVSVIIELANEGEMPASFEQSSADVLAYPGDAEIIAVYDPACTDPELVEKTLADVPHHLVAAPGRYYYEMKNDGAATSSADVLVFVDSDTRPEPGFLRGMVDPLFEQDATVVSCVTSIGPVRTRMDRLYASYWMFPAPDPPGPPYPYDRFMANGLAIRRADFERLGRFVEDSRSRGQCRSLAADIHRDGGVILRAPNSRFEHPPPYEEGFVSQAFRRGRDLRMSYDLGVVEWPGGGRRWVTAALDYARDARDRARALGCGPLDTSLAVGLAVTDMALVLLAARMTAVAPRWMERFRK